MIKQTFLLSFLILIVAHVAAQKLDYKSYDYAELNDMLSTARDLKDHKLLGDAYFMLSLYEEEVNQDKRKSIDYLIRARERYGLTADSLMMYQVDEHIARRNFDAELYNEALSTYEEMLAYFEAKDMAPEACKTLYAISQVYKEKGDIDLEQKYLQQALALNQSVQDTILRIHFMLHQSDNYQRLNEIDSAFAVSNEALQLSRTKGYASGMSNSMKQVADIHKRTGDYEQAITYYDLALNVLNYKPYSEARLDLLQAIADTHAKLQQYNSAYTYGTNYAALNDSILHQDRIEASYNYAQKYESLQKQKSIEELKIEKKYAEQTNAQQRRAVYVLGGGLALLLLLLYYIIRFYNQQIKTEKIITTQREEINQRRIKELQDDIQIRSMQSMIEGQEAERERIAKDLHDSLGGLLSTVKLQFDSEHLGDQVKTNKTFQKAHNLLDHAVSEVRTISQNLQPAALANLGLEAALRDLINRFSDPHYPDIDLQCYDIPKEMGQMHSLSIYRVIQEMLHNAIKHSKANEILIQINREDEELVIQFEDDGVGFDPDNLKRKGMGLSNIQSRIDYLKGTVERDSTRGEGTSYLIHVKWS